MKITDLFSPFPDGLQLTATARVSAPPRVEWASAWGDLFFRIKGTDPRIIWCVLGRGAPEQRPLSKARLETLNKYLSAAYSGRTFFRVVPFSDGDDWALMRPKRALVKSPLQRKGAIWQWRANFAAPDGEITWLSQPLSWFESWLRENADDELQSAREFARLSDDERNWLPVCRTRETREKWEQLLPALQKLSCGAVAKDSFICDFREYAKRTSQTSTFSSLSPLYRYRQSPDGHTILEFVAVLEKHCALDFQLSAWRGIGVRGKQAPHIAPKFTATEPTQHEKLEAALLWRDFGREMGESARVETALSQLLSG